MFFVALSLLLPLLASAAPSLRGAENWQQCGLRGRPGRALRIVHGFDSEPCVWRWQVALRLPGYELCGGTLIAPGWVLTAAHCAAVLRTQGLSCLQAHAGTSHLDVSRSTGHFEERRAKNLYVHPEFDGDSKNGHDFALLELEKPMPMNECIGVACLPENEGKVGAACQITGWGTQFFMGPGSEVLQQAPVTLLDVHTCQHTLRSGLSLPSSSLCASGNSSLGITDTCQGDSGGPLVCEEAGAFVVHGVTSWGYGCGAKPGFYGRVSTALSWIHDVLDGRMEADVKLADEQDVYFGNTDKNDMMFTGVRGPCIMDEFSCVMSPGYPNPYPSGESCQIAVSPQNSAPIHVTNFSTTFGDYLSFDCKYFTGGMGPEGIIPRSTIHWKPASIGAGWRICPGHKA